ncbi:hypothetical protein ACHAPD_005906 [Fusarium lateritium]
MAWQVIYEAAIKALTGVAAFATAAEKGSQFVNFMRAWITGRKKQDDAESDMANIRPSGASGGEPGAAIDNLLAARQRENEDLVRELATLRETVNGFQRQLGEASARSVLLVEQVGVLREAANGFENRLGVVEMERNELREIVNVLQRRLGASLPYRRVDGVRGRTTTGSSIASSHNHQE